MSFSAFKKKLLLSIPLALQLGSPVSVAETIAVEFEIPQINAAEYHRPYVAVWLENAKRKQVLQLAIWVEKEKWHRDLRSWWRRGGKSIELPLDGISGATRKPGVYQVSGHTALAAGSYTMNIEAVREVGGRELIRIPFDWTGQALQMKAMGSSELGAASLSITPEKNQ